MLALRRLQESTANLEACEQKRLHSHAELVLCDASNPQRQALVALTTAHVRWKEKLLPQVAGFEQLEHHPQCVRGDDHGDGDGNGNGDGAGGHGALALDCEMVGTTTDDMALARLSVVDVEGRPVLDVFVLPCEPSFIVDCRTAVTGLSRKDLEEKGVSLQEARRRFAALCTPTTVLMGHDLAHDLVALQFQHDLVIDTAMLYPVLSNNLAGAAVGRVHSLVWLAQVVLLRPMDRAGRGGVHDSVEDAVVSLDLIKFLVCALHRSGLQSAPPVPARGRKYKQRGSGFGVSGMLSGLQQHASQGAATLAWAKSEEDKRIVSDFYALRLSSSSALRGLASQGDILGAKNEVVAYGSSSSSSSSSCSLLVTASQSSAAAAAVSAAPAASAAAAAPAATTVPTATAAPTATARAANDHFVAQVSMKALAAKRMRDGQARLDKIMGVSQKKPRAGKGASKSKSKTPTLW